MTKSLDLGCGKKPKNPFDADELYGVDVAADYGSAEFPLSHFKIADLAIEPIPYEDQFFDYVSAHDFIEHIPRVLYIPDRRNCFVELMNEIYRVLKVGGLFLSSTPAYPHKEAFQDPTHVNIITEHTFYCYFDDTRRWATIYGFHGAFRFIEQYWNGPHLITLLEKVEVPALNNDPHTTAN